MSLNQHFYMRLFASFIVLLLTPVAWGASSPPDQEPIRSVWAETPSFLTEDYVAYSERNMVYVDPIAIRQGQQDVLFDTRGTFFLRMDVCIVTATVECDEGSEGNEWVTLWDNGQTGQRVPWTTATGLPQSLGEHSVRMRYFVVHGPAEDFTYQFIVVPPAQRAFTDGQGNSMIMWQGPSSALDSPLLVVEGIDGDNVNAPAHYYGIASDLFSEGRSRGLMWSCSTSQTAARISDSMRTWLKTPSFISTRSRQGAGTSTRRGSAWAASCFGMRWRRWSVTASRTTSNGSFPSTRLSRGP